MSIRFALYLVLFLAGAYIVYIGFAANRELPMALLDMAHRLAQGETSESLSVLLGGFISGGYIVQVPVWQARTAMILGSILCFAGYAGIEREQDGKGLLFIFSREYWSHIEVR